MDKDRRTKKLKLLLEGIHEARRLDPEMKIQTLEMLIRVALAGRSGIHMTDLQNECGLTLASTSRNVSTLSRVNEKGAKAWGMVESFEDPRDRRYKIVAITEKGREFAESLAGGRNGAKSDWE